MDYSSFFDGYETRTEILESDGFLFKNDGYEKRIPLTDLGLMAVFRFDASLRFSMRVLDFDTDQEYVLYRLESAAGSFVGEVRLALQTLLEELRTKDFKLAEKVQGSSAQMERLFAYAKKAYGEDPDCPFSEGDTWVLRCASNRKWYALFMQIPLRKLGLDTDKVSWVMNVRFDINYLNDLPKGFAYPAYHMNKRSWISIPLDQGNAEEELLRLLKESRERAMERK